MKKEIIELIKKHDSIALFNHVTPDGDSISSSYGLALALREKFPEKDIKVVSDIKYLKENFTFIDFKDEVYTTENNATLAIIGDVSIDKRIWYWDEFQKSKDKIIFDHHQNGSNFESNIFWHEPNMSASSLQAYEIVKELDIKLSEETAIALMIGILTDTAFFRFSGANVKPPKYFSELLSYISFEKINEFYNRMFSRSQDDIKLQQMIFNQIQYRGKVAFCIFDKNIMEEYGEQKIKIKVNSIGNIEGYSIWMFIYWSEEKQLWKVSIRSNKERINDIATKYNGGGHQKAAGCILENIEQLDTLIEDLNNINEIATN